MIYLLTVLLTLLAFLGFIFEWRQISPIALSYFAILSFVLALLQQNNWQMVVMIRYRAYWMVTCLAMIVPFFLLLLAFLMLVRIDQEQDLPRVRILFNLVVALSFIGIVLFTAWILITRHAGLFLFLTIYILVTIYLALNFILFLLTSLFLSLTQLHRQPVSHLIVLGAPLDHLGQVGPVLKRRLDKALKLYQEAGAKPRILVTGGINQSFDQSEGQAMRDYLVQHGVKFQDIILESQAMNTRENLKFARSLLVKEQAGSRPVLITSHLHLLRAWFYAWQNGISARMIGVNSSIKDSLYMALREFVAFFVLTKELNYLFMLGLLIHGIVQVLVWFR
ncbi:YdcF family protein [Facklamia languida]|uniref:DUF218 domain-containing protein n=1 Tax=Facklamia languida CCUG 37842 TaxID=883113 RepID=H3NHQ1_9LACT|nr:YdcF family protein [Facklamia languida]EHR37957.1 hypothetical protein HMPREF9708_00586 [Facklamia languida CCUG 37842]